MLRFIGLLVLVVAVAFPALGAPAADGEEELTGGAASLKAYVTKKGAKIRVYREVATVNRTKSTGQVEISIDQIQEVDDKLDALKPAAKVSSFANVDFTVLPVSSVQLGNSSGVYAKCLNCTGVLTGKVGGGDTAISLAVCAIQNNGTLVLNNEVTNVTAGQLKITFTMTSWGWTGANNKLAVDINIKTTPNRDIGNNTDAHGKPTKFSLGGDAFLEFSRVTYLDNQWYTMPTGYPLYKSRGANNVFRLIFDHFNNSVVYDPNVEVGYQVDGGTTDPNAASTVAVSFLPLLAAALLQIIARI